MEATVYRILLEAKSGSGKYRTCYRPNTKQPFANGPRSEMKLRFALVSLL